MENIITGNNIIIEFPKDVTNIKSVLFLGNLEGLFGTIVNNFPVWNGKYMELENNNIDELYNMLGFIYNCIINKAHLYIIGNKSMVINFNKVISYVIETYKCNRILKMKSNSIFKKYVHMSYSKHAITSDNDYMEYLEKYVINKNMKFDYIIQNPPYNGKLHTKFFEICMDLLTNNGKMVIIEPATWLIDIEQNNIYDNLKNNYGKHVYKVLIDNWCNEFNIITQVPLSITYIDKSNVYDNIDYTVFGYHSIVSSIYNCNLIGDINTIKSIFNKINEFCGANVLKKHVLSSKSITNKDTYYICISKILRLGCSDPRTSDAWFINDIYGGYYWAMYNNREKTNNSTTPIYALKSGYTYDNPIYKDELAVNIYGTKEEIDNYLHFVCNNEISIFMSICLLIDQHSGRLVNKLPWIVNKKYTNDELYKELHITSNEIMFIKKVIKKYNRYSPWFNRYLLGSTSNITDEEVQKFIESL